MTATTAMLAGFVLMVVLLSGSMPVAFTMAAVGFAGFALMVSPQAAMSMMTVELYDTFSSYSLTTIPLFVLMGQVAFHTGISRGLFRAAYAWVGHWPGGLAMSTVGACTAFGAICGSGPATAATMASVALPEMRRYKYDMELATGSVASGGSLGMMIPPSIVFIVYAILTEQSIGKLFIAGILPGVFMALLFCCAIYLVCRRNPQLGPSGPCSTWKQRFASLAGVLETLILFVLVMGGMFKGFYTATEAAAIGAAGSLIIALVKKELTWAKLHQCLLETIRTSCMVITIVAGAMIFGRFLAVTEVPTQLAAWLGNLPLPGWGIMALIIIFYFVAGCFIDALAVNLLTIPIFYPVVTALNYDLIWFGVIIVLVTQIGVITPPVGVNVYVVAGMARDVPMEKVFKGCMPFFWTMMLSAVVFIAFPKFVLLLPNLIK